MSHICKSCRKDKRLDISPAHHLVSLGHQRALTRLPGGGHGDWGSHESNRNKAVEILDADCLVATPKDIVDYLEMQGGPLEEFVCPTSIEGTKPSVIHCLFKAPESASRILDIETPRIRRQDVKLRLMFSSWDDSHATDGGSEEAGSVENNTGRPVKSRRKEFANVKEQLEVLYRNHINSNSRNKFAAELQNLLSKTFNSCQVISYGSDSMNIHMDKDSSYFCVDPYGRFTNVHDGTIVTNPADVVAANLLYKLVSNAKTKDGQPKFTFATLYFVSSENNIPEISFKYANNITAKIRFENFISLQRTKLVKFYMEHDVRVRPLFSLLRQWSYKYQIFHEAKEEEEWDGYLLILLMILFLTHVKIVPSVAKLRLKKRPPLVFNNRNISFCGERHLIPFSKFPGMEDPDIRAGSVLSLLKDFFRFYSELNFYGNVVCTAFGKVMRRKFFTMSGEKLLPPDFLKIFKFHADGSKNTEQLKLTVPMIVQDVFHYTKNVAASVDEAEVRRFHEKCKNGAEFLQTVLTEGNQDVVNYFSPKNAPVQEIIEYEGEESPPRTAMDPEGGIEECPPQSPDHQLNMDELVLPSRREEDSSGGLTHSLNRPVLIPRDRLEFSEVAFPGAPNSENPLEGQSEQPPPFVGGRGGLRGRAGRAPPTLRDFFPPPRGSERGEMEASLLFNGREEPVFRILRDPKGDEGEENAPFRGSRGCRPFFRSSWNRSSEEMQNFRYSPHNNHHRNPPAARFGGGGGGGGGGNNSVADDPPNNPFDCERSRCSFDKEPIRPVFSSGDLRSPLEEEEDHSRRALCNFDESRPAFESGRGGRSRRTSFDRRNTSTTKPYSFNSKEQMSNKDHSFASEEPQTKMSRTTDDQPSFSSDVAPFDEDWENDESAEGGNAEETIPKPSHEKPIAEQRRTVDVSETPNINVVFDEDWEDSTDDPPVTEVKAPEPSRQMAFSTSSREDFERKFGSSKDLNNSDFKRSQLAGSTARHSKDSSSKSYSSAQRSSGGNSWGGKSFPKGNNQPRAAEFRSHEKAPDDDKPYDPAEEWEEPDTDDTDAESSFKTSRGKDTTASDGKGKASDSYHDNSSTKSQSFPSGNISQRLLNISNSSSYRPNSGVVECRNSFSSVAAEHEPIGSLKRTSPIVFDEDWEDDDNNEDSSNATNPTAPSSIPNETPRKQENAVTENFSIFNMGESMKYDELWKPGPISGGFSSGRIESFGPNNPPPAPGCSSPSTNSWRSGGRGNSNYRPPGNFTHNQQRFGYHGNGNQQFRPPHRRTNEGSRNYYN